MDNTTIAAAKECDCVTQMNSKLKEHNARIATGIRVSKDMNSIYALVMVATEKIDKAKRKPLPSVIASFCPFCGCKKELGA